MGDDVILVSIGSEPMQAIPAAVLRHSILRRTARPVQFIESWTSAGWHPLMQVSPKLKQGTGFNTWRWLTPQLSETDKAIYLDSDQVVLADIGELWDSLPEGKTIAAVCNAVGVFGKKTPEPNHVQTSVMVMDCQRLRKRAQIALRECASGLMPYRNLMQATWLPRDEVETLDPCWNHFGIHTQETKLIHWSHVKSQPYRDPNHPTAEVFWRELRDAVEHNAITIEDVAREAERGHLHWKWAKRLRRDAA